MQINKKILWLKQLCGICLLCLVFACTEAEVSFCPEPAPETHGYVVIRPENSGSVDVTYKYHFYRVDTVLPYLTANCDGTGTFSGRLPAGTYRMIGTNVDAYGVSFRGMDNHETATVYATNVDYRPLSRGLIPANRMDQVYSSVVRELIVTAGDTIRHEPSPVYMTKSIELFISLDSGLRPRVSGLRGTLRGLYPSVHLYHQCPTDEAIASGPDMVMDFTATADFNMWVVSANLFGICDPQYGEAYRNIMTITLELDNGDADVEVDLTDQLSDIIAGNDGNTPIEVPLEIELKWDGIKITGTVKPWKEGGNGESPV